MGKYSSYSRPQPKPRPRGVHPVMRGIGCILIVLVPFLAYGASILLVGYATARGWPIPPEWYGPPTLHPLLWEVQGLQGILLYLQAQNNLEAHLIFTAIITFVVGSIMSMIYGFIYSAFGPPKYGPQDAPPIRKKVKPYKR
jgi:hypothetical protein